MGGCFSGFGLASKSKGGKIEIGYWAIRGLGAPLRMMCTYGGVEFTDYQVSDPKDWFGSKKEEIKAKCPIANLPYLIDGDVVVTQSNACFLYLGDRFGLNGKTPAEKLKVLMMVEEIYDLRNKVIDLVYPFKGLCRNFPEHMEKLNGHLQKDVLGNYAKVEGMIEGPFTLGSSISTPDFHIFEMLDQHEMMYEKANIASTLGTFPKLKKLYETVKALPELKPYFASPAYKFPVNNQGAGAHFF
mmetsp:Transcript_143208/g.249771  ORF Transcript_143208/g.249771 Transcript_143208/m.249771 type:complete len:243 (+) Transcript_143208:72-800(+)